MISAPPQGSRGEESHCRGGWFRGGSPRVSLGPTWNCPTDFPLIGGFKDFLFPQILGISSSQLTFADFSRWLKHVKTTNQSNMSQLNSSKLTRFQPGRHERGIFGRAADSYHPICFSMFFPLLVMVSSFIYGRVVNLHWPTFFLCVCVYGLKPPTIYCLNGIKWIKLSMG